MLQNHKIASKRSGAGQVARSMRKAIIRSLLANTPIAPLAGCVAAFLMSQHGDVEHQRRVGDTYWALAALCPAFIDEAVLEAALRDPARVLSFEDEILCTAGLMLCALPSRDAARADALASLVIERSKRSMVATLSPALRRRSRAITQWLATWSYRCHGCGMPYFDGYGDEFSPSPFVYGQAPQSYCSKCRYVSTNDRIL